MKSERSLSDFWRHDRSHDRTRELSSVLQGADILIGNMGSDIRVTWSGGEVSYTDLGKRIVALDYGPLEDQGCPFRGATVDEVVGYAAHEGGHCLWSRPGKDRHIRYRLLTSWRTLPETLQADWRSDEESVLAELCRIQNVLEDAYIDHQIAHRWPVLGEYIRSSRSRLFGRSPIDLTATAESANPHRNAAINLWVSASLYGYALPATTSAPMKEALGRLQGLSRAARAESDPLSRQTMAIPAAIILWQSFALKEAPLPLHPSGKGVSESRQGHGSGREEHGRGPHPDGVGNLDDFDPATGPEPGGRRVVPVERGLLNGAAAHLVEDLSPEVAGILAEDPGQVVARAKRADYDPEMAADVISLTNPIVRKVRQAFQRRRGTNTQWRKGLSRGRLDDRRLWKTMVADPGHYRRRDVPEAPPLAVGLLLDVSGSMQRSIHTVWQTAAVLSRSLSRLPGISFTVVGYTGEAGQVTLTRMCDSRSPRLCLANVEQGKQTPSGAAVAAMKTLMERMPEKRRLLIHFTDGRADNPIHLARSMEACRRAGIQIHTIGLAGYNSRMPPGHPGRYGSETIQQVAELPQAVARIVKGLDAFPVSVPRV